MNEGYGLLDVLSTDGLNLKLVKKIAFRDIFVIAQINRQFKALFEKKLFIKYFLHQISDCEFNTLPQFEKYLIYQFLCPRERVLYPPPDIFFEYNPFSKYIMIPSLKFPKWRLTIVETLLKDKKNLLHSILTIQFITDMIDFFVRTVGKI